MPNWCENRLSVTGPADDVTRFVEAAKGMPLVRHDPCIAVYTYTTPWGPGHVFFWRLSCLWPTLRFAVSYDEEFPSRGRFVASKGKVIRFDDTDSPDFTEEQQNADEEGCHDAWKKWRGELVATHDAWVADGSSMPEVSP